MNKDNITLIFKLSTKHIPVKKERKMQWGITSHQPEFQSPESLQITNAEEGVEKKDPSCPLGGNVNWHSHYTEQYGSFLKS